MAQETRVHLPEDEYLLLIGQVAYMVASLEGLVVFDLPGMSSHLPDSISAGFLAGKSTGKIAEILQENSRCSR